MMTMQMMTQGLTGGANELTGRKLEAAVLNKVATMLEEVLGRWDDDADHALLDTALKYNQALWTLFQAELMKEASPLPEALRENMLSLSTFVDRRTYEVMAYPEADKLEILIKINRNLADGLLTH